MKKVFLRAVAFILSSIIFISALVSCGNKEFEPYTLMPSDPSDRKSEKFMEKFRKGESYADWGEYGKCLNYMPEEISKKYGVEAFSLVSENETKYYLFYNDEVHYVGYAFHDDDVDHGFVQFAVADYNSDGYAEILCSFNTSRGGENPYCHSNIAVLDTKSKQFVRSYTYYKGYLFFKPGEDGQLDAYSSATKNSDHAFTLAYDMMGNTVKYEFRREAVSRLSAKYLVTVTVEEGNVHFPVNFPSAEIYFVVTTKMTYLGKTFTYTDPDTYCDGADPRLVNSEKVIYHEGIFAGCAMTNFTIRRFETLTREFRFHNYALEPNEEGKYDLIVEYRGTEVKVKNFVKISRE